MYRIRCAEVWGGISNRDQDVSSAGVVASLHSSASAGGKGGDIYYLSVCGNDHLTRIAIADVVGHGEAVSAVSEDLYQALLQHMDQPSNAQVLARLNDRVADRGLQAMTTAAIVGFYTQDSNLSFAYAGHAPVLVRRQAETSWTRAQGRSDELQHINAPLGVLPDSQFDEGRMRLEHGDRLFLYTDGVPEAQDGQGELFGEERLLQVLEGCAASSVQEIKQAMLAAVRAHTGGHLGHDDLTLMAMEIR